MASSDWKSAEQIAALLEKTLTPDANVRHNVLLPIVGRPDRKPRQCDVVVSYGKAPRESIAIVEVQKRSRKPDITTFHGWVAKMREVGAQQLICVSQHGYPASIIDEVASRIGPSVKLMTLRDLERGDGLSQLVMLPYRLHVTRVFDILAVGTVGVRSVEGAEEVLPEISFSSSDPAFSVTRGGPPLTMNEVIAAALDGANVSPRPPVLGITHLDADLPFKPEHDLWLHQGGTSFHVREWLVKVRVTFATEQRTTGHVPVSHLVYRQEMLDGVLAWVASMSVEYEGEQRLINIAFKRDNEGMLTCAGVWRAPTAAI